MTATDAEHATAAARDRPPVLAWLGPRRLAVLLSLAAVLGYAGAIVVWSALEWSLVDLDAYWNAAMRLRTGHPLYPPVADAGAPDVYRYAPWFAYAWVPLTFLPRTIVEVMWSAALLAAIAGVLASVIRLRGAAALALAALPGAFLVLIASVGNVQPLIVAALVLGMERRSGPLWIALSASLKAVPLLFVLVYIGRREWGRAAATVALTAILVAPMLAFDLRNYPVDPGELSFSLYNRAFPLWVVTTGAAVSIAIVFAALRSRYDWLAASVAVVMALPRTWTYDFTFLLAGLCREIRAAEREA